MGQHRCPSLVPARSYSRACDAFFFFGGVCVCEFETVPILHGTPQGFGAGTLMLGAVQVGRGRGLLALAVSLSPSPGVRAARHPLP